MDPPETNNQAYTLAAALQPAPKASPALVHLSATHEPQEFLEF